MAIHVALPRENSALWIVNIRFAVIMESFLTSLFTCVSSRDNGA